MENLKELVYIINKNKIKRIDLLDLKEHLPSKVNELYQGISNGRIETDEDASKLLFPGAKSKSAYRNLKIALRNKLLNTLFFIDAYSNKHTDRQTAFYEAYKDFAAAQLLLAKNARNSGIQLLEKILKKSEYYEFTELSTSIYRLLRLHYGARLGDSKKYAYFNEQWNRSEKISSLENKAEHYYSQLVIHYVNNKSPKEELEQKAISFYKDLEKDITDDNSYKFRLYTALTELFQYTCVNNYLSTIPICNKIITFFEQKPFEANTPIQICLHHQLVAFMQLRDFEQGKRIARRSLNLLEEGSFNWFKNFEYLFLLAMHTANYQKSFSILVEAKAHKRFSFLSKSVKEMWTLYHAYIQLLIEQGRVVLNKKEERPVHFRIQRFLNNMPLYSKDKRGMNIGILVVQILFYIHQQKHNQVIDRIDAIEKYCSRYLFKGDTMRSYYFIKLLLCIPKANFHRIAVERYAQVPLKKLHAMPSDLTNQFHKIEIIPYEILWDITLSMLDTKKAKLLVVN